MNRAAALRITLAVVLPAVAAPARDLYVSPSGDDAEAGTRAAPFRTIARARDAVRSLPTPEREERVTVWLGGGTYRLAKTVVFGVDDGGVTYQAQPGTRPVITSAVPVEDWQRLKVLPDGAARIADGRLWVADVPEGVRNFKVLFDGNHRLERARSRGFQSTQEKFEKFPTRNVANPADRPLLRRLAFPDGAIEPWDNLEDVEVFFCGVPWTQSISPIESVDLESRVAWLKYEGNTPPFTTPKPYNPAFIENALSLLDSPGEWCVDTGTRKIYYWPVNGEPGNGIVVPRLTEFFRVEGRIDYDGPVDEPVRNLTFRGLTFTQGDRYSWWKGHKGWGIQHDWDKFDCGNALLRFRGAQDCLVEACRFVNSGNSAIRLDLHAQNIIIQDNLIDRVGHMGILLCGYGPGTKDVNRNNRIENNLIRRTGELIWHGHAIFVWQSGNNRIANNHIREVPRKAIGICGVRGPVFMEGKEVDWDEASRTIRWHELGCERFEEDGALQTRLLPYLHARNNVVEDNYVYRARTKIGDGSALNVSGAGVGNVLRRNMVYMSIGNGLRCDDWQRGTTIEQNLILSGGVVHKGHNDVINNLFLNTNIRFTLYPGQQPDPGSRIHNNVFYFTRGGLDPYKSRQSARINTPESCDLRNNVYFCLDDHAALEAFLATKQAAGLDRGSMVADPGFERPLDMLGELKPDGFQFRADSPAVSAGFKQIDTSSIGLTAEFPKPFLEEVFPSARGRCVSETARVTGTRNQLDRDPNEILRPAPAGAGSWNAVYVSEVGEAPWVMIELPETQRVNGLEIVADSKDRQDSMRTLTVWSSLDGQTWREIWRADPYHIAMGRDWLVKPYKVLPARFVKVGLRPRSELQMNPEDERMRMGDYVLRLNRVRVFARHDPVNHPSTF